MVDATGDADVAHLAGAPTRTYGPGNLTAGWYYSVGREGYRLHKLGVVEEPDQWEAMQDQPNQSKEGPMLGLEGEELLLAYNDTGGDRVTAAWVAADRSAAEEG